MAPFQFANAFFQNLRAVVFAARSFAQRNTCIAHEHRAWHCRGQSYVDFGYTGALQDLGYISRIDSPAGHDVNTASR